MFRIIVALPEWGAAHIRGRKVFSAYIIEVYGYVPHKEHDLSELK